MLATGVTDEMDHAATKEGQLEAKLEALERKEREREEARQREEAWQRDLRTVEGGFRQILTSNSERWPHLQAKAKDHLEQVVEEMRDELVARFRQGRQLTCGDLSDIVEADLARKAQAQSTGPRQVSKTVSPSAGAAPRNTAQAVGTTETTVDHRKKSLHTSESDRLEGVAAVLRRMRQR